MGKYPWVKPDPPLTGVVPGKRQNGGEPKSEGDLKLYDHTTIGDKKVECRDRIRYAKNTLLGEVAKQLALQTPKEV